MNYSGRREINFEMNRCSVHNMQLIFYLFPESFRKKIRIARRNDNLMIIHTNTHTQKVKSQPLVLLVVMLINLCSE